MNSSELSKGIGIVGGLLCKGKGGAAGAGIYTNAGAPVNGTSGTFAGTVMALKGSLLIDTTNAFLYINTNTKASPTWTKVGTQT